jgi:hypothetical protein
LLNSNHDGWLISIGLKINGGFDVLTNIFSLCFFTSL